MERRHLIRGFFYTFLGGVLCSKSEAETLKKLPSVDRSLDVNVSIPSQVSSVANSDAEIKIYIGKVGGDPINKNEQIKVFVKSGEGGVVSVEQPLNIDASGRFLYNGSVCEPLVDSNYSLAITSSGKEGVIYFSNALESDFKRKRERLDFITPEMFGAFGDAENDDTRSWELLWEYVDGHAGAYQKLSVFSSRKYRISRTLYAKGHSDLYGGGTFFLDSDDILSTTVFIYEKQRHFSIKDITFTRNFSAPSALWSKQAHGVNILECADFVMDGVDIYMHTDAVSISRADRFTVRNCKLHQLGEEGIAIRQSRNFFVFNNDIFEHNGDGILLKTANSDTHTGSIVNNIIHHGLSLSSVAAGQRGGGITLNDENFGRGGSLTSFSNLIVSGNHIYETSYGIAFTNILNLNVESNIIHDVSRFGVIIDISLFNNENKNPINKCIISGNNLKNIGQAGVAFTGSVDISVRNTIISNNILDNCGIRDKNYPSIGAVHANVVSNIILDSNGVALSVSDCVTNSNRVIGSKNVSSGSDSNWIKVAGGGVFSNNYIEDNNHGHIRLSHLHDFIFSNNVIKLKSKYTALHFIDITEPSSVSFFSNQYNVGYRNVSLFSVGQDVISKLKLTSEEFGRWSRIGGEDFPKLEASLGSEIRSLTGLPGKATKWVCVESGNPGNFMPVEWVPIVVESTPVDMIIENGESVEIKSINKHVMSNYMIVGVKVNQDVKGINVTASVSTMHTVSFVLTNRTGDTQRFEGLVLTAHGHE
ncbi:phage tailspike protein [Serratia marcescens]|uniref:phage tailspike protein n=1 Tax=Serratia marcescens TaxID=615 RepID=UPI000F7E748B|nr:phage tailspike protein [Serratia marcescens]RTF41926.1 hypothetical protein D9B78_23650 [Serratia marcescens]